MIKLELWRRIKGMSQKQLGSAANVSPTYICNAEKRGMQLYPNQAERIATVLDWKGDPMNLFEEVEA